MTLERENFNKALTFIKRDGIADLVNWLELETDYFTAPSSSVFHGNFEGGLLAHSMNVTRIALHNLNFMIKQKPELEELRESVVICGLFHDLCKVNFYFLEKKWTKDADNKWKDYIGYKVNDSFPLGHGEKSIWFISKFLKLTDAEALAIRWHMGATEPSVQFQGSPQHMAYYAAIDYPLVRLIHVADMLSLAIEETKDYKNE
jgi:HD domain